MTKVNTKATPWSDEDFGYLQATVDLPAAQVAYEMGRSIGSIYNYRFKFRQGWVPSKPGSEGWLPDEDAFILDNPNLLAPEISEHLGRTVSAINQRRKFLRETRADVPKFGCNVSPFAPGARPLLARTCPDCGRLLQAKWFQGDAKGWCKTCKRCRQAAAESRGVFRSKVEGNKERKKARWKHLQRITMARAENSGKDWTEKDMEVLSDPDLTVFEKAILLKRSYSAVQIAANRRGFAHRVGLGDPERDQWFIDNPNAKEFAA